MYHAHRFLVYADATHHNPDHYRFDSYFRRRMDYGLSDSLAKSKRQRTGRCRLFGESCLQDRNM